VREKNLRQEPRTNNQQPKNVCTKNQNPKLALQIISNQFTRYAGGALAEAK
jgi:hypothetical protein